MFHKLPSNNENWLSNVKQRTITGRTVKTFLRDLSKRYCNRKGIYLSHYAFDSFVTYIGEDDKREHFVIDELRQILNSADLHSNLTARFYSSQAVRFLVQRQLIQNWRTWLNNNRKVLETGKNL